MSLSFRALLTVAVAVCSTAFALTIDQDPAHGGLASSSMVAIVDTAAMDHEVGGIFMVIDRASGRVVWQSETAGIRGSRNADRLYFNTSVPSSLSYEDGMIHTFRLDARGTRVDTRHMNFQLQTSDGTVHTGYLPYRDVSSTVTEVRVTAH